MGEHYKFSRMRLWVYRLVAPLIALIIRLFWMTCRVRIIGQENLDALVDRNKPIIPCYWHQRQVFCAYYLLRRLGKRFTIGYLVSPSKDGELVATTLRYFGARAIRGSATRTGAQAMRNLYQAVKEGLSPVMTPDGSVGPIFEFKAGPVMLAQLSGAPLIPLSYAAKKAWLLNSWDRFMIPRPFTRIVIALGPPRYVKSTGKMQAAESVQEEMRAALNDLGTEAEAALS